MFVNNSVLNSKVLQISKYLGFSEHQISELKIENIKIFATVQERSWRVLQDSWQEPGRQTLIWRIPGRRNSHWENISHHGQRQRWVCYERGEFLELLLICLCFFVHYHELLIVKSNNSNYDTEKRSFCHNVKVLYLIFFPLFQGISCSLS